MIATENLDRLTVIISRLVGGDAHLLTEEDLDLIDEACVHAEDVLNLNGADYIVTYDDEESNDDEYFELD